MKRKEKFQNKTKKCPHMKFDPIWGEWKCLKHQIRLYPDKDAICEHCTECKTTVKPFRIRKNNKE